MNLKKISRKKSHRMSVIRNLVTSLILYEQIKTTRAKSKNVVAYFDKLMSGNDKIDLNTYRRLQSKLFDGKAVKKMVDVILPRCSDRKSGHIKVYKLGNRDGDNSQIVKMILCNNKKKIVENNSKVLDDNAKK